MIVLSERSNETGGVGMVAAGEEGVDAKPEGLEGRRAWKGRYPHGLRRPVIWNQAFWFEDLYPFPSEEERGVGIRRGYLSFARSSVDVGIRVRGF